MASVESVANTAKKLECRFCQRIYSKAEHLTVGLDFGVTADCVRPFTCKECNRAFSRQDSLARHEKLHLRRESMKCTSPAASTYTPAKTHALQHLLATDEELDTRSYVPPSDHGTSQTWNEQSYQVESDMMDMHCATDLDFQLIWPDSEELFQSIMSSETTTQMPVGTLPFPQGLDQFTPTSLDSPTSFDDRGSAIKAIPNGGGHQAVHGVSKMISNLSSSITAEAEATSITSVFLDECLHMFFVRFIPTFPVLHRATFVFRDCTHPLLLNAIAIGSLYLGPKDAIAKGEALWRLSHTAVATSWQSLITHRGPHDPCNGLQLVQAALLGQVYAALSKNRALRTTSQIFHALGFSWARHCGMYDNDTFSLENLPSMDASPAEKDRQWKTWAAHEIQRRALLAQYILDGLVSSASGNPTSTRHAANQLGLPCDESLFEASTADEWLIKMRSQPKQDVSFRNIFRSLFLPVDMGRLPEHTLTSFSLRVLLEGVQSLVSDSTDGPSVGVPTRSEIRRALAQVHESITKNTISTPETLEALLRWHSICLDAATDSSMLCRHLCARYNIPQHVLGGNKGLKTGLDLVAWAKTEDARRALLHAVAIQDIVEQLPRGRAHVLHMPSSLFAAATVYSVFSLAGHTTVNLPRIVDWKDALFTEVDPCVILGDLAGTSAGSSTTRRFVRGEQLSGSGYESMTRNLLYELNSMQKLFRCLSSQWGLAYDMEAVLNSWISLSH
ncbi:C2H2 type zinc finger domain protein [Aureobasidium pullulans]|uniref:C2H2 type zinc finger domain protein n=1 Tax=Aureobasidium pullulans TaxID=5580 RepID=A0A4S9Q3Z2_AURPU|nr:C2H2 type zinc finger domain protein [Aureobasidium pullulans]THZ48538.1 C2H2 type zinc finger domain protein [Aureobasidium pullulans]THZ56298.1 C2H2 type zinc finger domain protein [Aureobasidium pullulans]TIA34934.1 C2H2 type zinc finger domain protein [Aureobasidium pullulans]